MKTLDAVTVTLLLIACTYSATDAKFCWKDSYGRGVGAPLSACPGKDKIGLLCYTKCPAGYARNGFDCHQICPDNFNDQWLFCRLAEYGRGGGYPWQFGDPLFRSDGQWGRCQRDYGGGNCEMNGLIVYPKCKRGYYAFGCCICRPYDFKCIDYGFTGKQVDLSCPKGIIIGDPTPMKCQTGLEEQAGLCYKPCNKGYRGIGPVCWAPGPKNWVDCGMGMAVDTKTCGEIIFNQIVSVGMLAANIATLGATGEAQAASKGAKIGSQVIEKLKSGFKDLKALYDKTKQFRDMLSNAKKAVKTAGIAEDIIKIIQQPNPEPADIIRITAEIVSLFDPTGIASVVAAYSYPLCSKIES